MRRGEPQKPNQNIEPAECCEKCGRKSIIMLTIDTLEKPMTLCSKCWRQPS